MRLVGHCMRKLFTVVAVIISLLYASAATANADLGSNKPSIAASGRYAVSINVMEHRDSGYGGNLWGSVIGAKHGSKVWTEVRLSNGQWSRSQVSSTNGSGYVIPVTYGRYNNGSYMYRVRASVNGRVLTSPVRLIHFYKNNTSCNRGILWAVNRVQPPTMVKRVTCRKLDSRDYAYADGDSSNVLAFANTDVIAVSSHVANRSPSEIGRIVLHEIGHTWVYRNGVPTDIGFGYDDQRYKAVTRYMGFSKKAMDNARYNPTSMPYRSNPHERLAQAMAVCYGGESWKQYQPISNCTTYKRMINEIRRTSNMPYYWTVN